MDTEKALSKSKEQEELAIAPEAAGLEARCDRPVSAKTDTSEIGDITFEEWRDAKIPKAGAVLHAIAYEAWKAAKATMPVVVSLRDITSKVAMDVIDDDQAFIKSVLDAAGVKYVDS